MSPALSGSDQLEFKQEDYLYRDIYFTGKNTFYGIETVYFMGKPVWGMSYYGNWGEMTEEEIDNILREALIQSSETRLDKNISWQKDGFEYKCLVDTDSIDEIGGQETIFKNGRQIYYFYYAGSILV